MKKSLNKQRSIIHEIANFENLLWAWQKAKNAYRVGDIWFDTLELAYFEANTHSELTKIHNQLINGTYELDSLKPLPYPKGEKYNDEDGTFDSKVRQTFYISVKDQVTWLAVVNVIGPKLDFDMPFWSYGNRLHYSIWYEDGERNGKVAKTLRAGWYRSSTRNIFRTWRQSWPLFRHTIALTIKKMSNAPIVDYSEQEKEMDDNNDNMPENFRAKYLQKGYWDTNTNMVNNLFWASIDFEKFYPNLKIEAIVNNITKFSPEAFGDVQFENLLIRLTTFNIEVGNEWTTQFKEDINLCLDDNGVFYGIPTGLYVAGFLANVALIEIDKKVCEKLKTNKGVAHFRYVDDHVILGYDFEQLVEWIKDYEKLIKEADIGVGINLSKTEPQALADHLKPENSACQCDGDGEKKIKIIAQKAKKECGLDPYFPTPLVTQTLVKVSNIADCDIDFLTEHEERQLISDLEHLLITDFPEHELKSDTRISFAASMLSSIMPKKRVDYSEVYDIRRRMLQLIKEFEAIKSKDDTLAECNKHLITKYIFDNSNESDKDFPDNHQHREAATQKIQEIKNLHKELQKKAKEIESSVINQKLHVFKLLIKAAKENHDKVKLWWRLIDYCYNTGISLYNSNGNSLVDILNAVQEVHDAGKSHKLSNEFLVSQFVLVLSDRLMKALFAVINDDYLKFNAECFINACLDKGLLDKIFEKNSASAMEYYARSFTYLRLTLGTAIFIVKKDYDANDNILDWNNNPHEWCQKQNVNFDKYLFYLMHRLNDKRSSNCFPLWESMVKYSNSPMIFTTPFIQSPLNGDSCIGVDHILLSDWIEKCHEMSKNPKYIFDPRLSEWMALKIVDRLVEIHLNRNTVTAEDFLSGNDQSKGIKIHPQNYHLPRKWITEDIVKNWSYYREFDFNDIKYNQDGEIFDSRYTPKGIKQAYDDGCGDFLSMYGFAVILCQLICHDSTFPWIWNIEDKNVEYSNYIFSNTNNATISSYTKAIIMACTLSRSRESFSLRSIFNELGGSGVSDDSKNDPPRIDNLSHLRIYIDKAIKTLEKLQISVGEGKPRQMIPVRLRKITENQSF